MRDGVCADDDTGQAEELADDDAEEGHELIDHEAGKGRAEGHAEDADEGEEPDDEVGVGVGWGREEECKGGPVGREGHGGEAADEAGLDEGGFVDDEGQDGEEDAVVRDPGGVGRRVVGHEEVEEEKDLWGTFGISDLA